MHRKTLAAVGILIILLVSLVGTAGAQSITTPETIPSATPTLVPGTKFFAHPIVKLLSAYFDQDTQPEITDPTGTPTEEPSGTVTPEPTGTEVAPESGLGEIGQQIAALHEQGMGFGVLVKIFAMAEASQDACPAAPTTPSADGSEVTPTTPTCTAVTADELVTAYKGGAGMGTLFKQYGKPALLGVGQVKKALKAQAAQAAQVTATPEPETATGTGPDNKPHGKGKGDHKPKK